jgi:hypothetical protein
VVRESRCGTVVKSGDMSAMAEAILTAGRGRWDRDFAVNYILENHTWDKRVAAYDQVLPRERTAKAPAVKP